MKNTTLYLIMIIADLLLQIRITVVLIVLTNTLLLSQSNTDVVAVSLGRSTVASSNGVDALFSNPANIGIIGNSTLSLTIAPIGITAGNTSFTLNDIRKNFSQESGSTNQRVWTNAERDKFFERFNTMRIGLQADVVPLATTMRLSPSVALGFGILSSAQITGNLPSSIPSILAGNIGTKKVEMTDPHFSLLAFTSYQTTIAYNVYNNSDDYSATNTVKINIGVSGKYLELLAHADIDNSSSANITPYTPTGWDSTQNIALDVQTKFRASSESGFKNFTPQTILLGTTAGSGFGVDLGTSIIVTNESSEYTLSCAILDLGVMSVSNGRIYQQSIRDTIASASDINETLSLKFTPTENQENYSFSLGTRLRIGGAVKVRDVLAYDHTFTLTSEYAQGFNNTGFNSTIPRVSGGLDIGQYGFLPALRCGISFGGVTGSQWSAGIGWVIASSVHIDGAIGSMNLIADRLNASWVDVGFRIRIDI